MRTALQETAPLHHVTVTAGIPVTDGWTRYLDVTRPDQIGRLMDAAAASCGGCPTRAAHTAAGTLLLGNIATALAAPIGALLTSQRRGLVIDPAAVHLRLGRDGVEAVAVGTPQLWVLPDDPMAAQSGIDVAGDLTDLRRVVADGYARLLTPLLDAARGAVRRGRRALWAEATERLASAVFAPLRRLGTPHLAPAEVHELLAVAPATLRHPVRWLQITQPDLPWKARALCCLAYLTPSRLAERCATCPATPLPDAVSRIRQLLAPEQPS